MDGIYVRQSIFKEESISIETQINFCKELTKNEYRIYKDEGISGKDMAHRPGFRQLQGDIERGIIRKVIVYKLDRFTRSILDFANMWDFLCKHKVEFVSVTEHFDTSTPIGKAMLFILAIFAQMEREQIGIRTADNYYARAALGRWPGGPAPYGYENIQFKDEDGHSISSLNINDEMEILKRIFSEYSDPVVSLGVIRKRLNEEGIKGPEQGTWSSVSIARVLRNPAAVKADPLIYSYYKSLGVKILNPIEKFTGQHGGALIGKLKVKREEAYKNASFAIGNWEGCIDSQLWLKCQEKLNKNWQISGSGKGKNTWITGLMKCGKCGRALVVRVYTNKEGKVTRYLGCSGANEEQCKIVKSYKLDEVEESVQKELELVLKQYSVSSVEIKNDGNVEGQIHLVKIDEKIQNLIQALSAGASILTTQYVNQELEKLCSERSDIVQMIETEKNRERKVMANIVFSELLFDEKKSLAYTYIEKIIVSPDHIKIKWKV